MSSQRGMVYLVGAGPGDPGLITRKGADVLARADVVVFDHLASPRLLELAPETAEKICAGKSSGHCILNQDEINRVLSNHASAGRVVVRLKGGDPFVFGRGAEEAEHLWKAGIEYEVIPGVTSGVGVTAYAGIPVTHRAMASAVAFVTGHDDPEVSDGRSRLDWRSLALFPGTLVVYMGVTHLGPICRTLIKFGKDPATPVAVIESGTIPSQRTTVATLESLPQRAHEARVRAPALLVVGDVVTLQSNLNWFQSRPLFGQRILSTRPVDSDITSDSSARLESLGAEVIHAPMVEIRPITDPGPLDRAIDNLSGYDWLVFTSRNGVKFFLERLFSRGKDLRALGKIRIAVIGPSTADALAGYHLNADLVADSSRSEGLLEQLSGIAAGSRILLARADRGRTLLQDELCKITDVEQIAVYHNQDADLISTHALDRIRDGTFDWITVTSSAIVNRLHAALPQGARERIGRDINLASISPLTTEAARRHGWPVAVEAKVHTWDGLIDALVSQVNNERP